MTMTTVCSHCRNDKPRINLATEYEDVLSDAKEVSESKCSLCGKRKKWWWFYKWPLTAKEMDAL